MLNKKNKNFKYKIDTIEECTNEDLTIIKDKINEADVLLTLKLKIYENLLIKNKELKKENKKLCIFKLYNLNKNNLILLSSSISTSNYEDNGNLNLKNFDKNNYDDSFKFYEDERLKFKDESALMKNSFKEKIKKRKIYSINIKRLKADTDFINDNLIIAKVYIYYLI